MNKICRINHVLRQGSLANFAMIKDIEGITEFDALGALPTLILQVNAQHSTLSTK